MSRLSSISSLPTLKEYAQGAAQEAIQPIADFIAPTVQVAKSTGRFKRYSEKHRFRIPNTLRTLGGRATELRFEASDATYSCEPHAIDFPVDNLEQLEAEGLEDLLREGASATAEVAALSHELTVINKALDTLGAGTNKVWSSAADPISDIDDVILDVLKVCGYGSLMSVGVLFGATAWKIFKNQDKVRGRFIVGNSKAGNLQMPTEQSAGDLFLGKPEIKTSFMVYDTAPEGVDKNLQFILDSTVLVFARHKSPTRRDPSFMKTFRLMNKWMVPGSYVRDDGRVEVAKYDWSEDVQVTNAAAGVRLNITTA